jgi:hypothetical protein
MALMRICKSWAGVSLGYVVVSTDIVTTLLTRTDGREQSGSLSNAMVPFGVGDLHHLIATEMLQRSQSFSTINAMVPLSLYREKQLSANEIL